MKRCITRRSFLTGALLIPWVSFLGQGAQAEVKPVASLELGPAQPFSFDWLREQAKQLTAQPYQAPPALSETWLYQFIPRISSS